MLVQNIIIHKGIIKIAPETGKELNDLLLPKDMNFNLQRTIRSIAVAKDLGSTR